MLFATVRQRKIYVKSPTTVIRNGVNVDWLTLDMDEEWAQMDTILCVFTNGNVSVEQLYTYGARVLVPWECLQETGFLTVSVTGYVQDEKVMTTMNPDSGWNVVQNGTMTGSVPLEPTPSLYEQVLAATGNATSAAKIANEAAEAASAAAEALETASEEILQAASHAKQFADESMRNADASYTSATQAQTAVTQTEESKSEAINAAKAASASAANAEESAQSAQSAATRAEEAAKRAEQAGGGSVEVPTKISDLEDDTEIEMGPRVHAADAALCDLLGRFIPDTYATKEEVGDIETALDGIIALQNSYIGGDA